LHRSPAPDLQLNEIGRCSVTLSQPIYFDPYRHHRFTGSFIIIDRINNTTVGAGMISDRDSAKETVAAWESNETQAGKTEQISDVTDSERSARFGQQATTILFTGLTGTGKTTIARAMERALFDSGRAVAVLDGEQMRRGVNVDLGYTIEERSENLRRSAHVAKLFNDNGLICLAAFVAPNQSVRQRVAEVIGKDRFLTIHCTAEESIRRSRDTKAPGRAEPAIDSSKALYEIPEDPDMVLDTGDLNVAECVSAVMELLQARGVIR
jgi:bifunctional enzyme CysN/CysC